MIYCQMEILEMKNTTTKIKISVDGLNSKVELLSKHETRLQKIPSLENRQKHRNGMDGDLRVLAAK